VVTEASEYGIGVAVDMMESGVRRAITRKDVVQFYEEIRDRTGTDLAFLEEPLPESDVEGYRHLRSELPTKVSGGEAITVPEELIDRVRTSVYDIAQPDATVVGGTRSLIDVLDACQRHGVEPVVHCWGGPVCMMANYHTAIAGGGDMVEWPLPEYPLREAMMVEPPSIEDGALQLPTTPGLGVQLTDEIESEYRYREDATFSSATDEGPIPGTNW
jgi:L-alanine-DL-glutamate epimerase-like enolase superfamily enzyme